MATVFSPVSAARRPPAAPVRLQVPREGPYRVVLDRLQRLVDYREQLLRTSHTDDGYQKAAAELVRVRHMIREVHRAVSINLDAKLLAREIDPGETVAPAAPYVSA